MPDQAFRNGALLIRGPFVRIPEVDGVSEVDICEGDVDKWAAKGWVDWRPANFARRQRTANHNRQTSHASLHLRGHLNFKVNP